jgi:hypothetical protein
MARSAADAQIEAGDIIVAPMTPTSILSHTWFRPAFFSDHLAPEAKS